MRHHASASPVTLRALLIGLCACVFISAAFPYENLIIKATRPANTALPYGAIYVFFLIVAIVNAVLGLFRARLSRSELTVIFVMILVSTAIPTWGLMAQLLPILSGASY